MGSTVAFDWSGFKRSYLPAPQRTALAAGLFDISPRHKQPGEHWLYSSS